MEAKSRLAFLVSPQWAPYTAVFTGGFTLATLLVCVYNYYTTYKGLESVGLVGMIGILLTAMVQGYQFVAPVIRQLKLMEDKMWETGLFVGWVLMLIIDFLTAFLYVLPYPGTIYHVALKVVVAAVFLIAEVLLWLGIRSTTSLAEIAWGIRLPFLGTPTPQPDKHPFVLRKISNPQHRPGTQTHSLA